jgi:hypothetical protein
MKNYQIQIAVGGDTHVTWSNRGTVRGKSMSAMLRRAYYMCFTGNFDAHPQRENILFHTNTTTCQSYNWSKSINKQSPPVTGRGNDNGPSPTY